MAYQTGNVEWLKAVLETKGEKLNGGSKQYVAITETFICGKVGFFSARTPVSSLPEVTFTYEGHARATEYASVDVVGTGTFKLEANFTNETASMSTSFMTGNQSKFWANNMVIDPRTGTFSTESALIGTPSADLENAAIKGVFAGFYAEGVHGIAYSNGDKSPTYSGVFYGKR